MASKHYAQKFLQKVIQVILQSRTGFLNYTNCCPTPSPNDWFNLCLRNSDEVEQTIESLREESFGDPLFSCFYRLDIIFDEGTLIEQWLISWIAGHHQTRARRLSDLELYQSLGQLLRAAITCTRALPTYQFCFSEEQRVRLRYQLTSQIIKESDPVIDSKQQAMKTLQIGACHTLLGTVDLTVNYCHSLEGINSVMKRSQTAAVVTDHPIPQMNKTLERERTNEIPRCIPAFVAPDSRNVDNSFQLPTQPSESTPLRATSVPTLKWSKVSTDKKPVNGGTKSDKSRLENGGNEKVIAPLVNSMGILADKDENLAYLYKLCLASANVKFRSDQCQTLSVSFMDRFIQARKDLKDLVCSLESEMNASDES